VKHAYKTGDSNLMSCLFTLHDIEKFKDDVRLCSAAVHVEPEEPSLTSSLAIEASNDSSCTDN
jgi:hypothetical protein